MGRGARTQTVAIPGDHVKKNEKNVYCLDCCISICPHCVPSHRFHRLLQVRRYVYHDVVRLEDLQKLIDCSNVQAYTINSAKVVFIKKRPENRKFKGAGNYCTSCDRSLQDPFIHCSLGCKTAPFLRTCNFTLSPDFLIPPDTGDENDAAFNYQRRAPALVGVREHEHSDGIQFRSR
ncbi:Detected protein of confused Function [Hibiscus syriacus]|uniref:Detected protein of confused Function n=1 Tax=Hibiscus syriacus TaxID=106335 RepID=A0A6A3BTG6_HIBSY|nr:Detected protein of confused Function [Hibiscus syriacus]